MFAPNSTALAPSDGVTVKKNAIGEPAHTGPFAHSRIESSGSSAEGVSGCEQSSNVTSILAVLV